MSIIREVPLADISNAAPFTNRVFVKAVDVRFVVIPGPVIADVALDAGNAGSICALEAPIGIVADIPLESRSRTQDGLDAYQASTVTGDLSA